MKMRLSAGAALLLAFPLTVLGAGDWTQFRGPSGNGISPEIGTPTRLDPARSIAWKVALPGRGLSSPIVVADRLFLTCASGPRQDRLHLFCFSTRDGKKLWERQFWATGRTMTQSKTCVAAPSPATDGRRIFALFSSNDLFCVDLDGNLLWLRGLTRDYPNASNSLGMASSLLVVGDTVIAQIENDSDSFAAGLDAATGVNRWRIERPKSANWVTPVLAGELGAGRPIVALQSSKGLQLVEASNGRVAGSYDATAATIPSSCAGGGVVYVPCNGITALRAAGEGQAVLKLWEAKTLRPQTASPMLIGNRLFVATGAGMLICADARTGEKVWQLRLKGPFSASPVAAANHAYLINEKGFLQVVDINPDAKEGKLVGELTLEPTILSTPAIAGGALYIRNDSTLWKIAGE